jgi:1-acyl-sn-glycerol-3-phosphate acyltransferase
MNKDQYAQILKSELGYRTPSGSGLLADYLPVWPRSLTYYVKLISTLVHASFSARRGTLDDDRWAFHSHRVVQIVESVGGKVNISGLEALSQHRGPVVYIGNHMSLAETLILPGIALAFSRVNFVIKEELRHYPVIGSIFKELGLIAVSRKNPREDFKVVLQEGHKFISSGGSVIIFPQATRSVGFDVQAFNTLGVKLASRAGVPVIPVAIKTDFQGNGKLIKDMGPIDPSKTLYFKFGEPMVVGGKGREAHQYVVEFISENLKAWGGSVITKSEVGMRKSEKKEGGKVGS